MPGRTKLMSWIYQRIIIIIRRRRITVILIISFSCFYHVFCSVRCLFGVFSHPCSSYADIRRCFKDFQASSNVVVFLVQLVWFEIRSTGIRLRPVLAH